MKKIKLKSVLYFLVGDTAGRSIVGSWKWLWGLPVESGGKIAQQVAQETIESMQQSVAQLTDSVAKVVAAYEQAKSKHYQKQEEIYKAQKQAETAHQSGNQEAVRLAFTKVIMLEKLLPQLQNQVAEVEKIMLGVKEKLSREKEKLETYKLEMANLNALSEINQALSEVNRISVGLNISSAHSQFTEAKQAIEGRYIQENVKSELLEDTTEKIESDLDQITLANEINRRLKQLENSKKESNYYENSEKN